MYSINDLLNLVAQQGASELRLEPGRPPMMILHGKLRVMDGPVVNSDEIQELFGGIATAEQRRELHLCGTANFKYSFGHSPQFSVRATAQGDRLALSIRNLAP